jgi:hypothetical protein
VNSPVSGTVLKASGTFLKAAGTALPPKGHSFGSYRNSHLSSRTVPRAAGTTHNQRQEHVASALI